MITKDEAEKILREYKEIEELERKKLQDEKAAKVTKGWKTCEWIVTPQTRQIFGCSENYLIGWHVNQRNSYNNETHGMFYYVTYQNVLMHDGGGTCVLRDGIVITNQDIQELNNGKIPPILTIRKVNPQTGEKL